MAGLSWLEKKAAAALFATPPEATFEEAMADFMRVESMDGAGTWKANLLMVAKVMLSPHCNNFIENHFFLLFLQVPSHVERFRCSNELGAEVSPAQSCYS